MSAADTLRRMVARLDATAIPYMVVGSFASTHHGMPRMTQDIDIVIAPTEATLITFLQGLPEDEYYVDHDVARDALKRHTQFNVVDFATAWKVDLIIRKSRPFSVEEFARRQRGEVFGVEVHVATAEDAILSKLEWAKLGDSELQLRDVAGILDVRRDSLDRPYIERWVVELGLEEEWRRVRPA